MALTVAQLPALNTSIKADATLNALPNRPDEDQQIANAYNLVASPVFVVWKSLVTNDQLLRAMNGAEFAALNTANATRLQTVATLSPNGVIPSVDLQAIFDDIFSVGGISKASLQALLRRNATRGERLYVTGTGTTASPGNLVFEGQISATDVESARNLG